MLDEALLIGIASIGVAVAGFTAVTAALTPPGGSWSVAQRIRQRAIVSTSFNVVFEALAPIIVFAWLEDVRASVTLASAVTALYVTWVIASPARSRGRIPYVGWPAAVRPGHRRLDPVRDERAGVRLARPLRARALRPAVGIGPQLLPADRGRPDA